MNQQAEPSKAAKRQLRELAALAYERELSRELALLERAFQDWRQGRISPFELSDLIHRFHNGPSRELYSFYHLGDNHLAVANALGAGVLDESEVPEAVRLELGPALAAFGRHRDERVAGLHAGATSTTDDLEAPLPEGLC